jgi:hypothetical protein
METKLGPSPSVDSLDSGTVVVPLVMRMIQPTSVVDFGCKLGEWLSIFREYGVTDVLGMDRPSRETHLVIPPAQFRSVDLRQPVALDRTFGLAVCMEVAEHLPATAAVLLVRELTAAASVVLFSAALPDQGGHGHVNEQPHEYWHSLFARHGYVTIDCIRPRIWQNAQVAYWYRQNAFVYASREGLEAHPALKAEYDRGAASDMHLIHSDVLRNQRLAVKLARHLPAPLTRALVAAQRFVRQH